MSSFLGSIQFHLSMCLSVSVPVPYCFDYCGFLYSLKSESVIPPVLFFFFRIVLAGLLMKLIKLKLQTCTCMGSF